MKIRNGFVSNSSSSSFICDFCGEAVGGMDLCLSGVDMSECENGHTVCDSEILEENWNVSTKKKALKLNENILWISDDGLDGLPDKEVENLFNIEGYDRYGGLPEELCPCCQFKGLSPWDLKRYLLKKINQTEEEITKEVRERFSDFDSFDQFIKGGKDEERKSD